MLERLETDYSLLTKLVQELHARIASLSTPSNARSQPAPLKDEDIEVSPSYSEPTYASGETAAETSSEHDAASIWGEPGSAAGSWNAARFSSEPDRTRSGAPDPTHTDAPLIAGRVLVTISPVPDFDRLLSLDGALGRMSGIDNVTLADYAREEVTFRVDVDPPTSVEDFRTRLSDSAAVGIEVITAGDDGLTLRLKS